MNNTRNCVAFDIGGSHGRCVLGSFDGDKLVMKESGEFRSLLANINGTLYWDVVHQFECVKELLIGLCEKENLDIDSIGMDSMGCNFALLDQTDSLIGMPYCTRVAQEKSVLDYVYHRIERDKLFSIAGMQPQKLNSLYFLARMRMTDAPQLSIAKKFMMLPDLLNFWLTGTMASEYSISSTSAMLDIKRRDWSKEILRLLDLDKDFCPPIAETCTTLGYLRPEISNNAHLRRTKVVESPMHDTASSLLCLGGNTDRLFISVGTWGIVGAELPEPMLSQDVMTSGLTNEGAAFKRVRLDYNTPGTSLLRACMEQWTKETPSLGYGEMSREASATACQHIFLNPKNERFFSTDNMIKTIQKYCAETNQEIPVSRGQIARMLTESLAMCFKVAVSRLEQVLNRTFEEVYMMGGGCRDAFLCQCTADALNKVVYAGPIEASSIGNVVGQLVALGEVRAGDEIRDVISRSFEKKQYIPKEPKRWDEDFEKCVSLHIY